MVRELGSERRETVRSLSAMRVEELRGVDPVREDRVEHTTGGPVVAPAAVPGSYMDEITAESTKRETQFKTSSSAEPW